MMREDLIVPDESDEKIDPGCTKNVKWEPFTTLDERMAVENPALVPCLQALKEKIGIEEYNKYINGLIGLKKDDTTVMLITAKEMHRTFIEGKFREAIKEAFGVRYVRTICQSSSYFF